MLLPRLAALLTVITYVIAVTTTEKQSLVDLYEATHVCVAGGVVVCVTDGCAL